MQPVTEERLQRILVFLSVGGGAALVSKRDRRLVAAAGAIDDAVAVRALEVRVEPSEAVVHVAPDGLVAEVGRTHRLFIRVPPGLPSPAFADRLRRARDLIVRFGLHVAGNAPASGSPGPAQAEAVVFVPRKRRGR